MHRRHQAHALRRVHRWAADVRHIPALAIQRRRIGQGVRKTITVMQGLNGEKEELYKIWALASALCGNRFG